MNYDNNPFLWESMGNWHYCRFCKHLHSLIEKPTCNAFPKGIPKDLLTGLIFHNKPMFNQKNAIIFETKYNG
jgi:hypothetical protein